MIEPEDVLPEGAHLIERRHMDLSEALRHPIYFSCRYVQEASNYVDQYNQLISMERRFNGLMCYRLGRRVIISQRPEYMAPLSSVPEYSWGPSSSVDEDNDEDEDEEHNSPEEEDEPL